MNLPKQFIAQTQTILGDKWSEFEKALHADCPISIRLNGKKLTAQEYETHNFQNISGKIPWAANAYYLKTRPVFTLDPLLHAGCYYIQEASSMFIEQIVNKYIKTPAKVLDLCAAPGGKATHLSSILPEGSLLVANETIRSRVPTLVENLVKWGNPNTIVTNCDPSEIAPLAGFFDAILCDLPCSGEGMFRKNPAAVKQWSVKNVNLCAERQFRIVSDVFPALKTGGILLYSTCTYNRRENEENLYRICRKFNAELIEPPHRFMIHDTDGEGFFIAVMRKLSDDSISNPISPDSLKIVYDGRKIITTENNTAPSHAIAMSTSFPKNSFPNWDTDLHTALKYLHGDALNKIPAEIPLGYVLLTYKNHPLGFVKNIGTRANNLYPRQWRIRMEIPPVML
ncbi:MAG: rRNA cytosine-C5-methyltransferase [Dysgonamonadaceae bacterium]|jgi:16S rRNA C967 or C1407 C5-methylase (RsmB/RsmF family)/NOL1/NOP2/fmu family ribosome biogenesis protein|nr:rRNA cytosine-C5-methyltransferase [Dysgonamonadaceae bacterium]